MIKYYITSPSEKILKEISTPQKGCWIHSESPEPEEIARISALTDIPESFMRSALDEEETAHVDTHGSARMVIIDIPKMIENGGSAAISTMPLALIQNDNYIVSICTMHTSVLDDFFQGKIKNAETAQRSKLIYQIMYNSSSRFLYYLRQIDKTSDRIQKSLAKSMQNKELLQLLELQKSLVFFSASLTANYAVVQKISNNNLSKATDEERDILEDVVIENKQAIEMCSVYREIIKNTMDAFASVVNNNMNIVMKFLTAITIILSIPIVIAGFWGMNTGVPFEGQLWGFWAATGISVLISVIIVIFMARKKMF